MNVVYDLLGFQSRDHGERGIARYVLNLALALERNHPGFVTQYLMHPDLPFPAGAEPLIATGRVVRADREDTIRTPSAGGVFLAGSLFEMHEPLDRVLPHWSRTPSWRTVAILYDLIPAKFSQWYLEDQEIRHRYMSRMWALAGADRLLAISQASADDAVSILGYPAKDIEVIGAGADSRFRRPPTDHTAVSRSLVERGTVPGLRPGYVMFPSGVERRKNIEATIEAYAGLDPAVRRRHQLVLVCGLDANGRHYLAHLAAEAGIAQDLLATGFVDDDTLRCLYQGAELVIFPSIYEGFGLPVLEAMQCGAPVICSDSSSLKEVQLDPEARFDPASPGSIGAALTKALGDDGLRDRLRGQPLPPFTWDLAAERTVSAIRSFPELTTGRGAPARPRLAVVTPMPPQRSGIANYAYQLLDELRRHCQVSVFVEADADWSAVEALPEVEVEPLDRLNLISRGGGAFDRVLYFVGNSSFHVEMFELLRTVPGWVLLHDARLTGLYSEIQRLAPERLVGGSVGATLAEVYPGRYRPSVEAMDVIPPDQAVRFGIFFTRELAQLAEKVLVHSRFAADVLELDAGAEAEVIFPHPCPAVIGATDERRTVDPVISTFGIVAPPKSPELVIAAMPAVLAAVPAARLQLVGWVDDGYRDQLTDLASELGVADAVTFTGHADQDLFASAQQATAVAVQLRASTNGESSGAVSELLSRGVPTVVSELGAMAELPNDAVAKLPQGAGAEALGEILIELLTDVEARDALVAGGRTYAAANSYSAAAAILAKTLFS